MVEEGMQSTRIDTKSLFSCGMHGAMGIMMSFGFVNLLTYLIGIFSLGVYVDSQALFYSVFGAVGFGIYGAYIGYVFSRDEGVTGSAIRGAVAGSIGGLTMEGILRYLASSGITVGALFPLFIGTAIAGSLFGIPKPRNTALLATSSVLGSAMGYGLYFLGEHIVPSLEIVGAGLESLLLTILPAFFFILLAIGIIGASIAVGLYLSEAHVPRRICGFLKMARLSGIVITILFLLFYTGINASYSQPPFTFNSIYVSSGQSMLYVPVLLDENGKVMEMYHKPAISGSATVTVIDTDHGKALKITGSGEIGIQVRQTYGKPLKDPGDAEKFINGFALSMVNNTVSQDNQREIWVYSENGGEELNYLANRDTVSGKYIMMQTIEPVRLVRGWQIVRLSVYAGEEDRRSE